VPAAVTALVNHVVRTMRMSKLITAAAFLTTFTLGATLLAHGALPSIEPPKSAAATPPRTQVKATRPTTPARPSRPYDRVIHTVTITGHVRDEQGRPVAGASVMVTDANRMRPTGAEQVLGRAMSGPDGRFVLAELGLPVLAGEPGAIPRPAEGRFDVAGWTAGRAFGWHTVQSYRPEPRPAATKPSEAGQTFYEGEPITSDLTLGLPARVHGRVVDDRGRPVAGAKVQVGYIDDVRRPGGWGTWRCVPVDADGEPDRGFNGISLLPEVLRTTHTDADGRYAIGGLPRDVSLLTLIDVDSTYEPFSESIATTPRPVNNVRSLGYDGVLDHTFVTPRTVRVRVERGDTHTPAALVTVLAEGKRQLRAGCVGTTDDDGRTALHLLPGPYTLRSEPPPGMVALMAERSFTVAADPAEQSVTLNLPPAAVVVFHASDAAGGAPVAGVGFAYDTDTTRDRREVQSRTAFVDHPLTGHDGSFRAVVAPGPYRFFAAHLPRGYEAVDERNELKTLAAGTTTEVRLTVRKQPGATPGTPKGEPPKDTRVARILARGEHDRKLIQHGTLRGKRTYQPGTGIAPERLRAVLDALDPARVPPLLEVLRKEFPEAEPSYTVRMEVTVDGPRRREQWLSTGESSKARDELFVVCNGLETVNYSRANAQVDIASDARGSGVHLGVTGIHDYCSLPFAAGPVVAEQNGHLTCETRSKESHHRLDVDPVTGFVYHELWTYNDNRSGQVYWQFAPRATPEGLSVPALSVEARFVDGRTDVIWIREIEAIDLSATIPPDTFSLAVPAGTLIIDYRQGRDDTYRGVLRAPVSDVVARADAIAATRKPFVPPVKPGDPAPPLRVAAWLDRSGVIEAPKLEGKVVLVDFWGVTCGPCVAALPEVREAVEHFAGTDLVIIGLHDSGGKVKDVAAFAARHELRFPLAIDRSDDGSSGFGSTFVAYGVHSIPTAAVLDRKGRLAFVGRFLEALARAAELLNAGR
jgi:peroxiredoxin/protocatechuate 3,4-dioxygenase beta subunit